MSFVENYLELMAELDLIEKAEILNHKIFV